MEGTKGLRSIRAATRRNLARRAAFDGERARSDEREKSVASQQRRHILAAALVQ